MQKALLKKQFLELSASFVKNSKTGKRRTKTGIILFAGLYLALFVYLGFIFYTLADALAPLIAAGMGWLYGALMGILALLFGTLGSAFSTYAGLYRAKDNDLLLSMPIPVRKILTARVAGVALIGMVYEAPVMIPALIASIQNGAGGAAIVCGVVLFIALGVLITALSCLLGWLVALCSAKFKNKSALTVIFSLVFLGVYYYFATKMTEGIQSLLVNSAQVGDTVRAYLYPFYQFGLGWMGDGRGLLIFVLISAALMALVWLALTRTFLGIATQKESGKKGVYREDRLRGHSVPAALFQKELLHFSHSPTYMLNCGLGIVMMLALAVLIVIYGGDVKALLASLPEGFAGVLPVVFSALVCSVAAMNDITAPSVSLEGKGVWIAQSMPVSPWEVLKSKLHLHEVMTLPPSGILAVCGAAVLGFSLLEGALTLAVVVLFVLATARMGLMLNLKMPSLNWTNETLPIKQSMAVMIALFSAIALAISLGVGGYFLCRVMAGGWVLALLAAVLAAAAFAQDVWLKKRGARIFAAL